MRNHTKGVITLAVAFLFTGTGLANHEYGSVVGEDANDRLGESVAIVGDVDLDGVDDVVVGAWGNDDAGFGYGKAYLFSGKGYKLLGKWVGEVAYAYFGSIVDAAGDVDGDGRPDILVRGRVSVWTDRIYLFSGKSRGLVRSYDVPSSSDAYFIKPCAGAGDVDRDGCADLIVGDGSYSLGAGRIQVLSGKTGDLIWSVEGAPSEWLGYTVRGVGDIDQDGYADVAASAVGVDQVIVFSGRTAARIRSWTAEGPYDGYGAALAGGADINRDGVPDVVVGAMNYGWHGKVYIYSGATGGLLRAFKGTSDGTDENPEFGYTVSCGDFNGDGYSDVAVGAPESSAEKVFVYCGRTGSLLFSRGGEGVVNSFGASVSANGDLNGDGADDLVVGSPIFYDDGIDTRGKAYSYLGHCFPRLVRR